MKMIRILAALCALVPAAALGQVINLNPQTFSGTTTFADNGTWGATGIAGTTINNTVIGGSTPLAGTFTTVTANTSVTTPSLITASGNLGIAPNGGASVIVTGASLQVTNNGDAFVSAAATNANSSSFLSVTGRQSSTDAQYSLVAQGSGLGADKLSFRRGGEVGTVLGAVSSGGQWSFGADAGAESLRVVPVASASAWIVATGSNGGNPSLAASTGSIAFTDTAPTMANLASSAAALDAVCWNASGGVLTHNGAGALCSASLEELKDRIASISPTEARSLIMDLDPFWGRFKDSTVTTSDHRISPMLGAHAVEKLDPRLAEYDMDGNLHGVRYVNLTAVLAAAYKEHDAEITDIRSQLTELRSQQANGNHSPITPISASGP